MKFPALIHDIKTPITVVKGNSEILQEEELNETQGSMAICYLSKFHNFRKLYRTFNGCSS